MSDYNAIIVPVEPRFVPKKVAVTAAVAVLRKLAPEADEIDAATDDNIELRGGGEGFEGIRCPACRKAIDVEAWQGWMDADWSETAGFGMRPISVPCCNRTMTLADLDYKGGAGFSRFALVARNPNKILAKAALAKLEAALGCKLRLIHERI